MNLRKSKILEKQQSVIIQNHQSNIEEQEINIKSKYA